MQYLTNITLEAKPNQRIFLVTDVHGHYDLLMKGLKDVGFNFDSDLLVAGGDLIDRGPDSFKCLQLLNRPWFLSIAGNHEEALDLYLKGQLPQYVYAQFGGKWAFNLSEEKQHQCSTYLHRLYNTITLPDKTTVVHAEPTNNPLDETPNGLAIRWNRDVFDHVHHHDFYDADPPEYPLEPVKYFTGHTPVKVPTHCKNMVNMDTGAFFTGNLTIYNTDTNEHFIISKSDCIKTEVRQL